MARHAPLLLLLAPLTACSIGGGGAPGNTDPACQIQVDGEKTPGYPFDLDKYKNEVLPVLTADCSSQGCHGPPSGNGTFTVWVDAAEGNCDYAKTFNSLTGVIDLANPGNSKVLVAISGALTTHPVQLTAGDPKLSAIADYVNNAAATYASGGGGTTPPPGASPFDYTVFQSTIEPILDTAAGKGCTGSSCHGGGAGGMTLAPSPAQNSDGMKANFVAVSSHTDLTNPASSLFYLKATTSHGGGQSAVVSTDQAKAILDWITAAANNNGGGPAPTCAPTDRFSLGVFQTDILPILRGDVDLNHPGGGTAVGCTRGPCHGTDRGPGALTLSDSADAATNLQNFSCFVNLISPSNSNILLCPLDDPRCAHSPHPGQNVFSGADDLNYQRILAYLYGSKVDGSPLDFAFFVRRVNPIFDDINAVQNGAQGRSCSDTVACHGVSVAGQAPPNGSNFPILSNATDKARLTYNFSTASSFTNFLDPTESSLFLYPTDEIADIANHPTATGLQHPGGLDFAVDSQQAKDILRWAGGLRPDGQGFVTDWLVAGDFAASRVNDPTVVDEVNGTPAIFDVAGGAFNAGQWDGLFSDVRDVDLNSVFTRDSTTGRVGYAVAYLVNTTSVPINAQLTLTSPDALRVYAGTSLIAQSSDGAGASAIATIPPFSTAQKSTRILIKVFQGANDNGFNFRLQLSDDLGNPLTDSSGEIVVLLGPQGGI